MKKLPSLIVADVDGTMVNTAREMLPYTQKMYEKLHKLNIKLGIASGRPIFQLFGLKDDWKLSFSFDLLIGNNGAELYDLNKKKTITSDFLTVEEIKEIFEKMEIYNNLCTGFVYLGETMYTNKINQQMIDSSIRHKSGLELVNSNDFFYRQEVPKILFRFDNPHDLDEVIKINNLDGENYYCFKTQDIMLEFSNRKINKANALKKYCENNHIKKENVIAAGDMSNDVGMIEYAGIGIGMINGSKDVLNSSNVITKYDNENDGLARCLNDILFDKNIL